MLISSWSFSVVCHFFVVIGRVIYLHLYNNFFSVTGVVFIYIIFTYKHQPSNILTQIHIQYISNNEVGGSTLPNKNTY